MRVLLGEKNVKLFPSESEITPPILVSYDEFFETYHKNTLQIILDRSCVDFSLDHLRNSNIYNALESLQCKRKILTDNEIAYLINKEKFSLLSKDDFYIQTCIINDKSLFQKITKNKIFLIEHAICKLCKSVTEINDTTWWLYIAEHKSSGVKIVAGIGDGIVYSRLFSEPNEAERKVIETIRFLTREGLNEDIKIVSLLDDLYIDNLNIINPMLTKRDIETTLVELIVNDKKIKPQFSKDSYINELFNNHNREILIFLATSCFVCFTLFCYLYDETICLKNSIEIEKEKLNIFVRDQSRTFSAKINCENIDEIRKFTELSQQMKSPIYFIEKISKILNKQKAEKILIEKNIAKIKCSVNEQQFNLLKKINNTEIKRIDIRENEYEDLDNSDEKKYGVEICIKMK